MVCNQKKKLHLSLKFKSTKHFLKFLFYIGVSIKNVVLVSGVQQSDSVIHIHVSILFQILFPFRLLQNIEQSSLCYTVGPCRLSILALVLHSGKKFRKYGGRPEIKVQH